MLSPEPRSKSLRSLMLHGSTHIDNSDVEARAKTLYNKLPGVLVFTNTRILWTKDGHSKPTVNLAHSKLTSLLLLVQPKLARLLTKITHTHCDCVVRHVFFQGRCAKETLASARRRST